MLLDAAVTNIVVLLFNLFTPCQRYGHETGLKICLTGYTVNDLIVSNQVTSTNSRLSVFLFNLFYQRLLPVFT